MQKFVYEYATKVYFGEGAAKEHLAEAVSGYGERVMIAYGGASAQVRVPGSGVHHVGTQNAGDFGGFRYVEPCHGHVFRKFRPG